MIKQSLLFLFLLGLSYKSNGFLWDQYNIGRLFAHSDEIFEQLKPHATEETERQCLGQFKYFVDGLKDEQRWTLKSIHTFDVITRCFSTYISF